MPLMFPKASASGVFMFAAIVGGALALFLQGYMEKERKHSISYISLERQRDEELAAAGVRAKTDKDERLHIILANLWEDKVEMARCIQIVEGIVNGLVTTADCKRIALGTKANLIFNTPKQNAINQIMHDWNSSAGTITEGMAANIYDALAEP